MAFLPPEWIPINTGIDLQIKISDKQVYGGPNTIKKSFSFVSATGVTFEHTFSPTIFRGMLGKIESIFATPEECRTLALLGTKAYESPSYTSLNSLAGKMGCTLNTASIAQQAQQSKQIVKSAVFISVFAAIGWILFSISFFLKLHYLASYKKHKKIIKSLQSYQSKQ